MRRSPKHFRIGFTLVEMMVVISIIIVMIAVAVPIVKTLTGNNSLAAAQNKVGSMLAAARADAIYNRQITGVLFFIDPATNAFAMAEVMPNQVYPPGAISTTSHTLTITTGVPLAMQTVIGTTANPGGNPASSGVIVGNGNDVGQGVPALEMVYTWQPPAPTSPTNSPMTKYYYRDVVGLPSGIGIALCNNNVYPQPSNSLNNPLLTPPGTPDPTLDRYIRFGAIMFSPDGTLLQMPFGIAGPNQVYQSPNPTTPRTDYPPVELFTKLLGGATGGSDITSQVLDQNLTSSTGILFYDRNAYLSQTVPGAGGGQFSDLDLEISSGLASNFKEAEEAWLDQNGVTAMVSPLNGNLVKGK